MSKRQQVLQPCSCTAKRTRPPPRPQQHVYLVVDDWEKGYSVRKLDLDSDAGAGSGANLDYEAEPLPEPPVVRLDAPHCRLTYFGGHGTSILTMPVSSDADSGLRVFDTKTVGLSLCPHPGGQKVKPKPVYASVAGKLYMMVSFSLCVLSALPPRKYTVNDEATRWSWTIAPDRAPMKSSSIMSTALHPDGRTLFVSEYESTFTLDTESLGWTREGSWIMPFIGQAYFDDELDAWVGLCRHTGGVGYVCCCDVPPLATFAADAGKCGTMPVWKLGKDRLFDEDEERHLGVILLCLGNSDYCLIENLVHKDFNMYERCRRPTRRVMYVTRFGLKYDKNGELRTTRRRARSYEMTEGHELSISIGPPHSPPNSILGS